MASAGDENTTKRTVQVGSQLLNGNTLLIRSTKLRWRSAVRVWRARCELIRSQLYSDLNSD
jgi:hypothetical protein